MNPTFVRSWKWAASAAAVLLLGVVVSVPARADGITSISSSSSTDTTSATGSQNGQVYGSSTDDGLGDQASSFVNLSTGEVGAYVKGEDSYTTTDHSDVWVLRCTSTAPCVELTAPQTHPVTFTFNITGSEYMPAGSQDFHFLDYSYIVSDGFGNSWNLTFDVFNDEGDFEAEGNFDGSSGFTDLSPYITSSYDANTGITNFGLKYQTTVDLNPCSFDSTNQYACQPSASFCGGTSGIPCPTETDFVFGGEQFVKAWNQDCFDPDCYIDSSHSMTVGVSSDIQLESLDGQTGQVPTETPEPSSWALLGSGLLGFTEVLRRKRRGQRFGWS